MFWVLQNSGMMRGWFQQGFGLELYDCICIALLGSRSELLCPGLDQSRPLPSVTLGHDPSPVYTDSHGNGIVWAGQELHHAPSKSMDRTKSRESQALGRTAVSCQVSAGACVHLPLWYQQQGWLRAWKKPVWQRYD